MKHTIEFNLPDDKEDLIEILEAIENNKRLVNAMQDFSAELKKISMKKDYSHEIEDTFYRVLQHHNCVID